MLRVSSGHLYKEKIQATQKEEWNCYAYGLISRAKEHKIPSDSGVKPSMQPPLLWKANQQLPFALDFQLHLLSETKPELNLDFPRLNPTLEQSRTTLLHLRLISLHLFYTRIRLNSCSFKQDCFGYFHCPPRHY